MATLFKKYEFDSQEQAKSKIDALPHVQDEDGNNVPNHRHSIVKLGYLYTTEPTYDEDGNELTAGVRSGRYSVDVLWKDLTSSPYGWVGKEVTPAGNGVHTFAGHNFS
tara:strand:- start:961 stop:1284 length:324 start_codon:yes stop_codon:yes gene_type:complete